MTKRRRTAKPTLSTSTAIVPTRSAEEEAWHDMQATIRKRKARIRKLQSEIRPLEEALARFERNYRVQLGGLQDELRVIRSEIHTLQVRTERIHTRMVSDPEDELGDLFTPEELEEIGKFFDIEIPESWFRGEGVEQPEGDDAFEDEQFDASGEGWHRIEEPETQRKGSAQLEELKALYRSLVRRFHPDLGRNEADAAHRHECMLRANHAWKLGDLHALQELADETERLAPDWHTWTWLKRLQSARRENDRITRQISKLRRRLKELRTNETFPLWSSGGLGESLVAARRKALERDIARAKDELEEARSTFRAAMEMWADQKATA